MKNIDTFHEPVAPLHDESLAGLDARTYRFEAPARAIRLTVPNVNEMMSICETENLSPGFFKLSAAACKELFPFVAESENAYFIWLPQETDDGLSYLAQHGPRVGNSFIDCGTSCQTHLFWSRQDGGEVAIHWKYFELYGIDMERLQIFIFANHNRVVVSIEWLSDDFVADFMSRILNSKDYHSYVWGEDRADTTLYLHGVFFSPRSTTTSHST